MEDKALPGPCTIEDNIYIDLYFRKRIQRHAKLMKLNLLQELKETQKPKFDWRNISESLHRSARNGTEEYIVLD